MITALRDDQRKLKEFPLAKCTLRSDRVYYRDRLLILEDEKLRLRLLQLCYDSSYASMLIAMLMTMLMTIVGRSSLGYRIVPRSILFRVSLCSSESYR